MLLSDMLPILHISDRKNAEKFTRQGERLMKKLLKTLLVAVLAVTMLSGIVAVNAQENEKKQVKIYVVGNSILNHGPNESLGWSGSWGMAASSEENDYYHILQKQLSEKYPNVEFKYDRIGAATLERAIIESQTKDYTSDIEATIGAKMKSLIPDIVILQIAENAAGTLTDDAFKHAFVSIAEYCEKINPDVKIVYCTPMLGGEEKARGIRAAAEETGHALIELIKYNTPEYKATGLYEHAGVAGHPGDKGMLAMGTEMADACSVIIDKMLDPNEVAVRVDGVYVKFDVKPQIVEGRTMVPLRAIFEALGATVEWNGDTRTVSSSLNGIDISLTIGESFLTRNGEKKTLDVPGMIVDSRTLVPVRAISEAFDCEVEWVNDTRTVLIKMPVVEINGIVNGDAETPGVNNFYSPSATITIIEDYAKPGNHVYHVEGQKKKAWTYIQHDYPLEVGATYKISADLRAVSDSDGSKKGMFLTFNARYNEQGATNGRDHLLKNVSLPEDGSWVKFETTFTVNSMQNEEIRIVSFYAEPISETASACYDVDNFVVELVSKSPVNEKVEEKTEEKTEDKEVQKPEVASNGITNGDAETEGVNNFTSPNAKITRVEDSAKAGNHVWRVTGPKEKAWAYMIHDYPLVEGTVYKLSVKARAVSDTNGNKVQQKFHFNVQYNDETAQFGKNHQFASFTLPADGSWVQCEKEVIITNKTGNSINTFSVYADPTDESSSAIFEVDDFVVTPVN